MYVFAINNNGSPYNQYSYVSLEIINDDLIIKTTDQKIGFYSSLKIDNY